LRYSQDSISAIEYMQQVGITF